MTSKKQGTLTFTFKSGVKQDKVFIKNDALSLSSLYSHASKFINDQFPQHGIQNLCKHLLLFQHDYSSKNVLVQLTLSSCISEGAIIEIIIKASLPSDQQNEGKISTISSSPNPSSLASPIPEDDQDTSPLDLFEVASPASEKDLAMTLKSPETNKTTTHQKQVLESDSSLKIFLTVPPTLSLSSKAAAPGTATFHSTEAASASLFNLQPQTISHTTAGTMPLILNTFSCSDYSTPVETNFSSPKSDPKAAVNTTSADIFTAPVNSNGSLQQVQTTLGEAIIMPPSNESTTIDEVTLNTLVLSSQKTPIVLEKDVFISSKGSTLDSLTPVIESFTIPEKGLVSLNSKNMISLHRVNENMLTIPEDTLPSSSKASQLISIKEPIDSSSNSSALSKVILKSEIPSFKNSGSSKDNAFVSLPTTSASFPSNPTSTNLLHSNPLQKTLTNNANSKSKSQNQKTRAHIPSNTTSSASKVLVILPNSTNQKTPLSQSAKSKLPIIIFAKPLTQPNANNKDTINTQTPALAVERFLNLESHASKPPVIESSQSQHDGVLKDSIQTPCKKRKLSEATSSDQYQISFPSPPKASFETSISNKSTSLPLQEEQPAPSKELAEKTKSAPSLLSEKSQVEVVESSFKTTPDSSGVQIVSAGSLSVKPAPLSNLQPKTSQPVANPPSVPSKVPLLKQPSRYKPILPAKQPPASSNPALVNVLNSINSCSSSSYIVLKKKASSKTSKTLSTQKNLATRHKRLLKPLPVVQTHQNQVLHQKQSENACAENQSNDPPTTSKEPSEPNDNLASISEGNQLVAVSSLSNTAGTSGVQVLNSSSLPLVSDLNQASTMLPLVDPTSFMNLKVPIPRHPPKYRPIAPRKKVEKNPAVSEETLGTVIHTQAQKVDKSPTVSEETLGAAIHTQAQDSSPSQEEKTQTVVQLLSEKHLCYECPECFDSFERKSAFSEHLKKEHRQIWRKVLRAHKNSFLCEICGRSFAHKRTFLEHIRKKHMDFSLANSFLPHHHKCPECKTTFPTAEAIYVHFKIAHNVEVMLKNLTFSSFSDFETWKKQEEDSLGFKFKKSRGDLLLFNSKSVISYLRCPYNGEYVSHSKGIRSLKSQGSMKIGGFCPAFIKAKHFSTDKVEVHYIPTHFGHRRTKERDLFHATIEQFIEEEIIPFEMP